MRKSCCGKCPDESFRQLFFVKTVEQADAEETKMTTTVLPNQTNKSNLKIQNCLQLGFFRESKRPIRNFQKNSLKQC